jgi:hypothetical protein
MANVTKSQPQNIMSPDGNSLAVFVDGVTSVLKLKDIQGNIEPLSNYIPVSEISPFEYGACDTSIQARFGNNSANGNYSTIIGGQNNNSCGFDNTMIIGSNLCASQSCTTFMNCASVNNLTSGCFVSVGTNKVLQNASFTPLRGLFSQTANSTPITATTSELTLIDGGVGTLSVPANGFSVGDSFTANISGMMSAQNNNTIIIRIKSGSVILAESPPYTLPAINNQVWNLDVSFTIRALGVAGVGAIATLGQMHILKLASGTQEGFGFNNINTTTFDTTILNTLNITAQWSSNSATNSIYSDIFVLTKIY